MSWNCSVGVLGRAVRAWGGPQQGRLHLGVGQGWAVGANRRSSVGAGLVAERLAGRLDVEEFDGVSRRIAEDRAEVALSGDQRRA